MTPASLTASSFNAYPQQGRALARQYVETLRAIPLAILPGFLEQIRGYAGQFPPEQAMLRAQLEWMAQANNIEARAKLLQPFAALVLTKELELRDWLHDPQGFTQALAAYLWQSRQIDGYRASALELFRQLPSTPEPTQPALVLAVIGRDAQLSSYPLFMRLRGKGLYAHKVVVEGAREALLAVLQKRSQALSTQPYAHWYVDGGEPWQLSTEMQSAVTHFTYPQLSPINQAVLNVMDEAVRQGTGPEILLSRLSHLTSTELGAGQVTPDPRLQKLCTSLLTSGSGTQIYSTSFMQAAAVTILRRAQPSTFCFRFAPRRRQASINDMIENRSLSVQEDPEGSLVDADMAAYYAWLELAKLPGGERASFVVWVEGRSDAFVIGPNVPQGVESASPMTMEQLLALALS